MMNEKDRKSDGEVFADFIGKCVARVAVGLVVTAILGPIFGAATILAPPPVD